MTTSLAASGAQLTSSTTVKAALTGLIRGGRPMPEELLRAAWAGAAGDGDLTRGLAAHPDTPADILAELVEQAAEDASLGGVLLARTGAPEALRARVAVLLAHGFVLDQLMRKSADPVVLHVLAQRCATAPRGRGRRWVLDGSDNRRPADNRRWEGYAAELLANEHLALADGRQLATAMLPYLQTDLEEALAEADNEYALDGERSIIWPGVATWLRRDTTWAQEVAATSEHPWVLEAVGTRAGAPATLRQRVFDHLIAPALAAGPPHPKARVPVTVGRAAVALAGTCTPQQLEQLSQWLRQGWNLDHSHTGLKAIAWPLPPDAAVARDEVLDLFATGTEAQVLDHLDTVTAAGVRGVSYDAIEAFIARPEVSTASALRVAGTYNDHGSRLLTLRSFDRQFCTARLAGAPGRWDDVLLAGGDVDLVLAAVAHHHADKGAGRGKMGTRDHLSDGVVLGLLGEAAAGLPWPVLADLAGLSDHIDAALTDALAATLAHPGGAVLLPAVADQVTGPLHQLVDTVHAALSA